MSGFSERFHVDDARVPVEGALTTARRSFGRKPRVIEQARPGNLTSARSDEMMLDICSSCKAQLGIKQSTPLQRETSEWVVRFAIAFIVSLIPSQLVLAGFSSEPGCVWLSAQLPSMVWAWMTVTVLHKCNCTDLTRFGLLSFLFNPVGFWYALISLNVAVPGIFSTKNIFDAPGSEFFLSLALPLTYCVGVFYLYGALTHKIERVIRKHMSTNHPVRQKRKRTTTAEFALIALAFIGIPLGQMSGYEINPFSPSVTSFIGLTSLSFVLAFYGMCRLGVKVAEATHCKQREKFVQKPHKLLLCSKSSEYAHL